MSKKVMVSVDGNEACANIAHKVSEVVAIYPITPSSTMAELSDLWAAKGVKNIWGQVPRVIEMQSEGGAIGAVHGSLQAGAMTTTFTASQGLLLMIPNFYKIAGELTPAVFHVSARAIAAQGLSIFGDHSDIMSMRQTGFALLGAASVQEAQDMALVAHAATLEAKVPFVHFFDGFRTSHEIMKIDQVSDADIRTMIDEAQVEDFRKRALTPDAPLLRGTAQNPDVYFQGRESVNPYYEKVPGIVQKQMDRLAELTGRQYSLVEYYGAEDAERVVVIMGSGAQTVKETVKCLNNQGEKVGVITVRLYRPFPKKEFVAALPKTVKSIAVLDRCKEPGSAGEPLFQDVLTAVTEAVMRKEAEFELPRIIGGRYGLSSKEFTPAMVKAVTDELKKADPKGSFTVGIIDDVSHTSLDVDSSFRLPSNFFQAMFYGLGADGTVGANKNSIKIIGENTDNYTQGYFVFDSKKSGSMTISHLRFGEEPINAPYLIEDADFIACHHTPHLAQIPMLEDAKEGAIFLLNTTYGPDEVWDTFPRPVQQLIIDRKIKTYVIDAYNVARETGMGRRINGIMQTSFFAISGVIAKDEAIEHIKVAIKNTYGSKGEEIVKKNWDAVDQTLEYLHEVKIPEQVSSTSEYRQSVSEKAPEFVKKITAEIMFGRGDDLPVSAMPADGTYPTATAKWEKRDLSLEIPVWEPDLCIQCGKCAIVCPHATIRTKAFDLSDVADAPETFKYTKARGFKLDGDVQYSVQISPYDCTGCTVCVDACPAIDKKNPGRKAINMAAQPPIAKAEAENWDFFIDIPEADRLKVNRKIPKGTQILEPLFEFSGACPGCGETPYIKLVTQLFGDRMIVANATGCSSIYGGNLPTTPWATNKDGRGPSWSNSLFEDNAEFGLGMRLGVNKHANQALLLIDEMADKLPADLITAIKDVDQSEEEGIETQRENVLKLREELAKIEGDRARLLEQVADYLVKKSVWIIGGDGWAYDIGYGGLDHVIASGENVNILILDTEVYSNTGGQASKATNLGAVAQFAAAGKRSGKKDLGLIAMAYKNVYVGYVAMGANDGQTIRTLTEAENFNGPSVVIAYSPCIAHGYDLGNMLKHQDMAVKSGYWPLMRYNPDLADQGKAPLVLDSRAPSIPVKEYIFTENRYRQLLNSNPEMANKLADQLQTSIDEKWEYFQYMSNLVPKAAAAEEAKETE
ncbi:MAG: pyruvate:ferredoxin (flavodoxin) oxidoreductase [Fibrobacter sp.]|nr:pyruvate:ferredoxin (flavodoxin) oxidoreductase [Fibrobacter sp.]